MMNQSWLLVILALFITQLNAEESEEEKSDSRLSKGKLLYVYLC